MSSILSIAVSGITAASERLQDSASNVANVESDGPTASASAAVQAQYPAAYTPKELHQVATAGGGTKAVTTNVQPATVLAYDPTAPYADANGDVAQPNVDSHQRGLPAAHRALQFCRQRIRDAHLFADDEVAAGCSDVAAPRARCFRRSSASVIAGLDPAIHASLQYNQTYNDAEPCRNSAWIRGSSPRMTDQKSV